MPAEPEPTTPAVESSDRSTADAGSLGARPLDMGSVDAVATMKSLLRDLLGRLRADVMSDGARGESLLAEFNDALSSRFSDLIYSDHADDAPFLSVVLVASDISDVMLDDALLALDAQSDTDFELIVVASSHDVTRNRVEEILQVYSSGLAHRSSIVTPTSVREQFSSRRELLRAGCAAARGRYVVVLDASSVVFAHFVETFHRLAHESPAAALRARALRQPVRHLTWPDGHLGFEPTGGAVPASAAHFSALEHLAGSTQASPAGSYALRRDYVEELGLDDEATMLVEAALLGGVREAPDEVVVLLRHFDHSLNPYTSTLLTHFSTYLNKVDPSVGVPVTVTPGEPDYSNLAHAPMAVVVGERSETFLRHLSSRTQLHQSFRGAIATNAAGTEFIPVTLLDRWDPAAVAPRPASFRVLAIVTTYNEADVIEQVLERLSSSGVHVHVIDNWSSDQTPEILEEFAARTIVTWERFPQSGDTGHFELENLLRRVEEVAAQSGADWVIHHDADEIRESPWPGVSLIDALWALQQWGYNCIDHTVINFRPVDNSWSPRDDLASSFPWCEFGDTPADFLQIKGWKPQVHRLTMASNAGHQVQFEGRRVFPYKFPLRHYSIRSQEHGERKILRERRPRWSEEERAKGWHVHYDHYDEQTSFLWSSEALVRWDTIDEHHLLGRLSGVGLVGNPWPGEGPVVDA